MDNTRSLYDQSPQAFWGSALTATVWILNVGLDLFQHSANPMAGLAVPIGLFYMVWVVIWYYLRDQRNPLCYLGNVCLLMAMSGYVMYGLGLQIASGDFLSRYAMLPILGPSMGVVGAGLLVLGVDLNARTKQTSPIVRRRDSTIC
ncbi:MAG: hypothetical protein ABI743_05670 [bacterium]